MVSEAQYEGGYELKATLGHQRLCIGSAELIAREHIIVPDHIGAIQMNCDIRGDVLVYIALGDQLAGVIELQPTLRSEAKPIISQLKQRHLAVHLISGDDDPP